MKELTRKDTIPIITECKCILCKSDLEVRSYSDIIYEDRILYYGYKCQSCKKEFNFYATIDEIFIEENEQFKQINYKDGPSKGNFKKFELKVEGKKNIYALIKTFNDKKYKITLIYPTCWY